MLSLITLVAIGTPAVGLVAYAIVNNPRKNARYNSRPGKYWYK